jgi:hypothetical protein
MAKKKKQSPEERHRQLQDQVQALPYAIADLEAKGQRWKAFSVRYLAGPMLRLMKKMMDRQRYAGKDGAKLKQSEQMKRHLEQRTKAMQYVQGEMRKQQKSARGKGKPR